MTTVRMSGMQAPAGGCVSEVNRQEYKGGQFVPVHGVFCGAAGKKRKQVWDRFPEHLRIDHGGRKLYEVYCRSFVSGTARNSTIGVVLANSGKEAVEAVQARGYKLRPGTQFAWFGR